uniref:Retrotransposable element Tf2 n=1 Tax=Rhizophora mucronata TaxID=61149 RepID=A0A2P2IWS4_RHIMU
MAMYMDDKADVWFQGWITAKPNGSRTLFERDLCRRFGDTSQSDVIRELQSLLLTGNPSLTESFFISSFLSWLNDEIRSIVKNLKPSSLEEAFELVALQEFVVDESGRKGKTSQSAGAPSGEEA